MNSEIIIIPVKLLNEDGCSRAQIIMKREMFSNNNPQVTILWKDSSGEEIEHCYYENLTKDQKKLVDETITNYDANMVKKSL